MDMTNNVNLLKEYYSKEQVVQDLVYKRNPFLSMLKKDTDFAGTTYSAPVIIAGSAGSSATFSEAQSNATSTQSETFKVDTVDNYVVATLAEKFRRASRSDAGAFMNGAKTVLDVHVRQWSNRHAQGLFRTGTGTIGQIASGKSTGILVLANRTDARFFSKDMKLEAYSGDGTGSTRAGAGYVIAVDAAAGVVTVSATRGGSAGQPSEWDDGDYLVQAGDRNLRMAGLLAWLPIDRTGLGTPFFGVTRSTDPQKLAGTYADLSGLPIQEALITGVSLVTDFGGSPDVVLVNPTSWRALSNSSQTQRRATVETEAKVGFNSIVIDGEQGDVPVVSDPNCPPGVGFALQLDTWKQISLGKAPDLLTYLDDAPAMRAPNADAMEFRIGGYTNLVCNAPGWNGVFKLPV